MKNIEVQAGIDIKKQNDKMEKINKLKKKFFFTREKIDGYVSS